MAKNKKMCMVNIKPLPETTGLSVQIYCTRATKELFEIDREADNWVKYYKAQMGLSPKEDLDVHISTEVLAMCISNRTDHLASKIDEVISKYGSYDFFFHYHPCNDHRNYNLARFERAFNNCMWDLDALNDLYHLAVEKYGSNNDKVANVLELFHVSESIKF